MTRIDFYLLSASDAQLRRLTACKLVEKIYRQGLTVYLRTQDAEETRLMDDLIWTFRQGSFVPHEVVGSEDPQAPIQIGHEPPQGPLRDVLVNLGQDVPPNVVDYARVAELVDQDEAVRNAGRSRYKQYQANGFDLTTHQL